LRSVISLRAVLDRNFHGISLLRRQRELRSSRVATRTSAISAIMGAAPATLKGRSRVRWTEPEFQQCLRISLL
jgi:hypothetical protein